MGTLFENLRASAKRVGASLKAFYQRNRLMVLGGATIMSILLIAWARLGFSFDISRFYAAGVPAPATLSVTCSATTATLTWNVPANADSNSVQKNINGQGWAFLIQDASLTTTTLTDTFTPTTQYRVKSSAAVASNTVQCPAATVAPTTTPPAPSDHVPTGSNDGPSYTAVVDANRGSIPANSLVGWAFDPDDATKALEVHIYIDDNPGCTGNCYGIPGVIADKQSLDVAAGYKTLYPTITNNHGFLYDLNSLPAKYHDGQDHTATVYGINIPPPNQTATATNVSFGLKSFHLAVVSTPVPTATATAVASPSPTATATVAPTASPTASPTVAPSPTPIGTATDYNFAVSGRNSSTASAESGVVSALGGQQVEVIARVTNAQSTNLSSVTLLAPLPNGLVYVANSTSVNGAPTAVETIATSGLTLAGLGPNQTATVRFRARIVSSSFPVGQSQTVVTVNASGPGVPSYSSQITVIVTRSAGVGTVQTGPGDAVVVAVVVSTLMTLLYVSYTHTAVFRRREIDAISTESDPLDFRS